MFSPLLFYKGLQYPGVKSFEPDKPGKILLMDLNEEDPIDGDGLPELLVGAEDGFFYTLANPVAETRR